MSPERRTRWLANLEAAGIEADRETLERIEPGLSGRLDDLQDLLDRLGHHSDNPDYLASRSGLESRDERA